ncbi:MAG TPA: sulfatase [Gemmatimonadaceae bacterium]|nr:sulfatase [Gemmatimonadaceae bacterium]
MNDDNAVPVGGGSADASASAGPALQAAPHGAPIQAPSAPPPASFAEILALAWWFGLAAGIVYAATQVVRHRLFGLFTWVSPDLVWMSSLAHVALFLPVALLIALMSRGRPWGRTAACGTFAFLATLSQLLPYEQIARVAQAIVALGVATQVARLYAGQVARLRPRLLPSAVVVTLMIVLRAVWSHGWETVQRSRQVAALPAPAPAAPNVLLIILDTVRDANMSLFGYRKPTTPQLERRAADATVFDRAFATAPWTLPSHATMMTGRYPHQVRYDWRYPMESDGPTLAELFRDRGYRTGGFVANLLYTSRESGIGRGFIDYRDYPVSRRMVMTHAPLGQSRFLQNIVGVRTREQALRVIRRFSLIPSGLPADEPIPASHISNAFLDWQARLGGRPFFAFLNYFDAHGPYRAPTAYYQQFGDSTKQLDRYDAAIAYLDAELGRVLDTLAARGALENTVVVITSDHGELFGEHGLKGHANGLYLPLLQVPLIIRFPAKVPRGQRVREAVSLRDLAATIAALAGLPPGAVPGTSLARAWTAPDSGAGDGAGSAIVSEVTKGRNVSPSFPNATTGLVGILDAEHHYIRNGFGTEQLFRWVSDTAEQFDLAGRAGSDTTMARLRAALERVVPGR